MEQTMLNKLFAEFGNAKPKKNLLFKKQPKTNSFSELSELILNPLKQNLKKDILTRANKLAEQVSLSDTVFKVASYLKKLKIEPNALFEFNNNYYNRLNKQGHSERVLFYCLAIAASLNLPAEDVFVLTQASKFHDIGRNIPESDLMHGQKSAGMVKLYQLTTFEQLKDYNAMLSVIDAHSAYDKNIEGVLNKYDITLPEYNRVKNLCFVLKDAEALDKVRFFADSAINTERMLKSTLLKNKFSKQMVGMAFELNEYYSKHAKEMNLPNF